MLNFWWTFPVQFTIGLFYLLWGQFPPQRSLETVWATTCAFDPLKGERWPPPLTPRHLWWFPRTCCMHRLHCGRPRFAAAAAGCTFSNQHRSLSRSTQWQKDNWPRSEAKDSSLHALLCSQKTWAMTRRSRGETVKLSCYIDLLMLRNKT